MRRGQGWLLLNRLLGAEVAGDWIKLEKSTLTKPEVLVIADRLGVHRLHAFGLCVSFWSWCDDQLEGGCANFVTEAMIDSVVGVNGFASSLIEVGWLRRRDGSVEVPNFDRHLAENAKKRANSQERKAKQRAKDVTRKCDIRHSERLIPAGMRRDVFARDGGACRYCGWTQRFEAFGPYAGAAIHIDHVVPYSRGGQTDMENLVVACSVCNLKKGDRTPEEAGMVVTKIRDENVTREEKRREENSKDKIHSATTVASAERPPSKPAKQAKPAKTPRQRDELYDAIAAATGCQGAHVGKVAAELRKADPPYTPADVAEFGERFYELCPHAIGGPPRLPNVGELEKYISRVRAAKPTAPPANLQMSGLTTKTREAIAVHDDLDRMIAEAREREEAEQLAASRQALAIEGRAA